MNGLIAMLIPAGLLAGEAGQGSSEARNDPAAFQGKWTVLSVVREGKIDAAFTGATRTVTGNRYSLAPRSRPPITGTMVIGPQAGRIDLYPAVGDFQGQTLRGIYAFEGNTLKICFAEPGRERPTEFVSRTGSGHILVVQMRVP